MKLEASFKFETTPKPPRSPTTDIEPPESRAVRVLSGRALRDAIRSARMNSDSTTAKAKAQRVVVPASSPAREMGGSKMKMRRAGLFLPSAYTLVRMKPAARHAALRGVSARRLLKIVQWARRYREAITQDHFRENATAYAHGILASSHDELVSVLSDSMPRHRNETDESYASRLEGFVERVRGRLM